MPGYTDRIEVERYFSRSKRCYGLGYIVTKLEERQLVKSMLVESTGTYYNKGEEKGGCYYGESV